MLTQLTSANYKETIAATDQGVIIFFKKLCAHCKNMEKVLEKFGAQRPGVALFAIDSEEEPAAMQEYDAERTPTLVVIKGGKNVATKKGLMNPREMASFFDQAK